MPRCSVYVLSNPARAARDVSYIIKTWKQCGRFHRPDATVSRPIPPSLRHPAIQVAWLLPRHKWQGIRWPGGRNWLEVTVQAQNLHSAGGRIGEDFVVIEANSY